MTDILDYLVLGAGKRGLHAALRLHNERRDALVRTVEAAPVPGGSIQTQRSNGFSCEQGPFAFTEAEIEPLLGLLRQPPTIIKGRCDTGLVFDGSASHEAAVDAVPVSFASGCGDLIQACRRQLGDTLWLGREVTEVQPAGELWNVVLGGEVKTELAARTLVCCLPLATAAKLLGGYDPALGKLASELITESRAFVFLGGLANEFAKLTGYGIVPAEGVADQVVETIFCSNVFARRTLPDRFLARSELVGCGAADDASLTKNAIEELKRWTGCTGKFGFTKVHRFESLVHDATWAECHTRMQGLVARIGNLQLP